MSRVIKNAVNQDPEDVYIHVSGRVTLDPALHVRRVYVNDAIVR